MILFLTILAIFGAILYFFCKSVAKSAIIWYNDIKDTKEYRENLTIGEKIGVHLVENYRKIVKPK